MKTAPKRIDLEADIVVIGGGTAGTAAAIAAARRGHRVLLVEESNCLGGTSTSGGLCEWFASLDGIGDIFARSLKLLDQYGAKGSRFYNPEVLKIVWQMLAEEAGVRILFHSTLREAKVRGRLIEEVGLLSCSRPISAKARFFIDASGEGDLGFLAGAEFMQGDPVKGRTLFMSLTFTLYDTGREVKPFLPPGLEPIKDLEDLPGFNVHERLFDNRVYCNMTKVLDRDPTNPLDLSAAECEARRQLARVLHFLQSKYHPRHALCSSGARIGIREGRRIVGDYVMKKEDILGETAVPCPDGVAVATSQIDFHSLTRYGNHGWRQGVRPYLIPFRSMVAKGFDNFLMAGKCISVDQVVHSSCRMTPTCCAMGQAAGTASAIAIEKNARDIRKIPIDELRRQLARDGMELDPARHKAFALESSDMSEEEKGFQSAGAKN